VIIIVEKGGVLAKGSGGKKGTLKSKCQTISGAPSRTEREPDLDNCSRKEKLRSEGEKGETANCWARSAKRGGERWGRSLPAFSRKTALKRRKNREEKKNASNSLGAAKGTKQPD